MTLCGFCGYDNEADKPLCKACGAALTDEQLSFHVRKTVTSLFSDIVGSTSLAEGMDAEPYRYLLSRYVQEMSDIILHYGGTLEKFIGDAIKVVFGVPVLHDDDALRAVLTAHEMRRVLHRLNTDFERIWGVRIRTRTAINTGEVLTGPDVLSESLLLGDAMNVVARLQEAAAPDEILLGSSTYELVRDSVDAQRMPPISLKGRSRPVTAYRFLTMRAGSNPMKAGSRRRFIERTELRVLAEGLERVARSSEPYLLLLLGEPGLGKSRLLSEARSRLGIRAGIIDTRCLPYGSTSRLEPLSLLVRAALPIIDRNEHGAQHEDSSSPVAEDPAVRALLDQVLGRDEMRATPDTVLYALTKLLRLASRDQPLVVMVDDVHWASDELIELIEGLSITLHGSRVFLVCTARPNFPAADRWVERFSTVELEPLSEGPIRQLIQIFLDDEDPPTWVVDRIQQAAGGNPLFVEHLVSRFIDEGVISRKSDRWVITDGAQDPSIAPSVLSVIASRLDRLPVSDREVLQAAAVLGDDFSFRTLRDLCGKGSTREGLRRLSGRRLISRSEGDGRRGTHHFSHLLVRDAAYREIPKRRRALLHERVADLLEKRSDERGPGDEEAIGYHLEQAYRQYEQLGKISQRQRSCALRAADLLGRAAGQAHAREDARGAVTLFERALALLNPRDSSVLELSVAMGEALLGAGSLDRANEFMRSVVMSAHRLEGTAIHHRAVITKLEVELQMRPDIDLKELMECATSALWVFEREGDHEGCAKAWCFIGQLHNVRGQQLRRLMALQRALAHARSARSERWERRSRGESTGAALLGPTNVTEATKRIEETLRWAEERGSQMQVAGALASLAQLEAMRGDLDRAQSMAVRATSMINDFGFSWAAEWAPLAGVGLIVGDLHAAEQDLRRAYDFLTAAGDASFRSTRAAQLAMVVCDLGRPDEAQELIDRSIEITGQDDLVSQIMWRRGSARVLAAKDRFSEAERVARAAVDLAAQTDYLNLRGDVLVDLARLRRARKDEDEARSLLLKAGDVYERKGNVVCARRARSFVDATRTGVLTDV